MNKIIAPITPCGDAGLDERGHAWCGSCNKQFLETMEQLIMKFKLPLIQRIECIEALVNMGYAKTGNKFDVVFSGSKGYLDHIAIRCEGTQSLDVENRISLHKWRPDPHAALPNKDVHVFHSTENGVRIVVE